MTGYKDENAVYALNSYTWKLLEANLGWTRFKTVPRIIPASQQPELLQDGKAFIVYGSGVQKAEHLYQLKTASVAYTIYAPTATEANKIVNLIAKTFDRQDEAAYDVNDWLDEEANPESGKAGRTGGRRKTFFHSVRTKMTEEAEPADEEGGYLNALVLLEITYSEDDNTTHVTSGFKYP